MKIIQLLCIFIFCNTTFAEYNLTQLDSLKNKHLIAIGESGHAVANYHNIRSSIVRRFVQNFRFRNIIIESELLEGFAVDQALTSCSQLVYDPKLINKVFETYSEETYRHKEFFQLFRFVCDWNHLHPNDLIHLMGMDIWSGTWDLRKFLAKEFIKLNIPELNEFFKIANDQCFLWSLDNLNDYPQHEDWIYYEKYHRVKPERHLECITSIRNMKNIIQKFQEKITQVLGRELFLKINMIIDTGLTLQHIRDIYDSDFSKAMNLRDAAQARNTLALLNIRNLQNGTIFMAHNVHVFQKMSLVPDLNWSHVTSSGEWLKNYFGSQMSVIGLGGYDITSLRDGSYPIPTQQDSLDLRLHMSGEEFAIIDTHKAPWKHKYWRVHNETSKTGLWINLEQQTDFYIYIDKANPATSYKPLLSNAKVAPLLKINRKNVFQNKRLFKFQGLQYFTY